MRRRHWPCAALLGISLGLVFAGCRSVPIESLRTADDGLLVASFNVHYLSPRNEAMNWDRRKDAVLRVIREMDADLIGFQEMETFGGGRFNDTNIQLSTVRAAFPEYGVAAVGDPREYPSTQPILYRKAALEPIAQGFFFFSPAPDTIYSRPWHKRYPAFASWVRFRSVRNGQTFSVFNIHADASSPRNRLKTARLVTRRIEAREIPAEPVILLGDFNAPASFPSFRVYVRAGFPPPAGRRSTYHFNRGIHLIPAIDHILARDGFVVSSATVVRRQYDGIWPSDHYPILGLVRRENADGPTE